MFDIKNHYFAAKEPKDAAKIILSKANLWYQEVNSNGYLDKLRNMWAAYHGAYHANVTDGHDIIFTGEQGEIIQLNVNHMRNLATHMLNMITANRPALQARAVNNDNKSLIQTKLANGLLDYYLREKRLEKYLKTAVEYAIVFGAGFIKMDWNSTSGEIYDINPETNFPEYEGDVEFRNLSPFDVVFDSTKEGPHHDWVVCRTFKNKYDLIAKYPEYENEINALPTKSDQQFFRFLTVNYDKTDDVPVYEFYHRKSEAIPEGRYLLFLSDEIILLDMPLPYRNLPIYRIAPADFLGTPYGYTPLFDIFPIQQGINSLYSTILTNQNAFGVQNIWVPRGADVAINQLAGALNIIEGNSQFGKPEPLQLTATPREVFDFLIILERACETISGVNSVARGNPEPSLKSGNALALIQSMALQFMSGLQQSYIQLLEDVGTGLINMLKDFAKVPRIAAISGKYNQTLMKEFSGDDLELVNRVIVDVGNPLAKTTAGKVQMAEQLLQMGLIKSPEEYFTVMETGRLDVMYDDTQRELQTIHSENEKLMNGQKVLALAIDQHALHIKKHKLVIADPDLRFNPELIDVTLKHIQEHIDLLRNTDPDLLKIIMEQPLAPLGGMPANQPQMIPPQDAQGMIQPTMESPPIGPTVGMPGMPEIPLPPPPFENAPMTPEQQMASLT